MATLAIALAALMAIEALVLLLFFLPSRRAEAIRQTEAQLSVIANDRDNAVSAWVLERVADARVAAAYLSTEAATSPDQFLSDEGSQFLERFLTSYAYDGTYIADSRGQVLIRKGNVALAPPYIAEFVRRARASDEPVVDFCVDERSRPKIITATAFRTVSGDPRGSLVLMFVADPNRYVYPILHIWDIATKTGETTLARVEGDIGVALTPLRHSNAPPMTLRRPVAATAAGVARTHAASTLLRYRDYRDTPVLAELRPIRGTRWLLIVKMDEREALAPAAAETRRVAAVVALATVGIAWVLLALLRSRRVREIRAAEGDFRRLFDNSVNGIFVCELIFDSKGKAIDHRFVRGNPAFERLTGVNVASQIGRTSGEMAIQWPQEVRDRLYRVAIAGEPIEYERFSESLGRWYDTRVFAPRHGEFAHVFTEISERKRAEEALNRLGVAVSQLAEAIVVMDPAGVIQYTNPAFEQMTAYSRDEAIGMRWPILCEGQTALDAPYEELWKTVRGGATWQGFLTGCRKDGIVFEQEATVSPVIDNGTIINIVAVKRDVTKERSLVAQLLQAQKMEAVGMLAGGVAHDFNNLLQGMMMLLQVASRVRTTPEKLAHSFAELEKLVRRGASLTKQLLLLSRRDVAKPELLDLNHVVAEAITLLRRLVRENIAFESDLGTELLPVTVDRAQIEQSLINLVVNASDAMPEGGRIRISTGGDNIHCWVIVEDTGHGIAPAIRDRVFEPFFTTKGKDKGTGLGLSVVHGIVTEHRGTISFSDVEHGGTRFRIALPRTAMDDHRVAETKELPKDLARGRGERILVVEDEESVRAGLKAMLELLNYRSIAVDCGTAALALPADAPFELLLTDVVLPDLAGPQVAHQLVARWPRMKTILMSGYSDDPTLRREATAGTAILLGKPFDLAKLAAVLRETLDASRDV